MRRQIQKESLTTVQCPILSLFYLYVWEAVVLYEYDGTDILFSVDVAVVIRNDARETPDDTAPLIFNQTLFAFNNFNGGKLFLISVSTGQVTSQRP